MKKKNQDSLFLQWHNYILGGRDLKEMSVYFNKNKKGENKMTKREELKMLAAPISKFISDNYDTGYKVVIDCDNVDLLNEVISIEISEEK